MASKTSLVLLLFLSLPLSLAEPTSLFINRVSEYAALPSCAEHPLSVIVRDMSLGCGDHNSLTSYDCFCTSSSSRFSSLISSSVAKQCASTSPAAVASALEVFHSYCELKDQKDQTAGSTPTSPTLSPVAATPTSAHVNGSVAVVGTPSRTSIAPIPSSTSGAGCRIPGMDLALFGCGMLILVLLDMVLYIG